MVEAPQWNPRRQGDIGELSAITWLVGVGATVSVPLFHSPDYDLIADFDGRIIKRLDATRCDSLFVHVGDGRRWYIPASALGGGSGIALGGPKYSEYEIEPGQPLQPRFPTLDSAPPWRDSRAVKGDAL